MKRLILLLVALLAGLGAAGQELSISTNLADYALGGSLNLDAAYGVARHWSVGAGAKYSPFEAGDAPLIPETRLLRQRTFSAGTRWWPWHIYSGWWMGAGLRWQEFSEGAEAVSETTEGDRFGGSLSAGYSAMLAPHFNLDFGLGFWGGYSLYTTYACRSCGRRLDHGSRIFILPSDLLIGISYIF